MHRKAGPPARGHEHSAPTQLQRRGSFADWLEALSKLVSDRARTVVFPGPAAGAPCCGGSEGYDVGKDVGAGGGDRTEKSSSPGRFASSAGSEPLIERDATGDAPIRRGCATTCGARGTIEAGTVAPPSAFFSPNALPFKVLPRAVAPRFFLLPRRVPHRRGSRPARTLLRYLPVDASVSESCELSVIVASLDAAVGECPCPHVEVHGRFRERGRELGIQPSATAWFTDETLLRFVSSLSAFPVLATARAASEASGGFTAGCKMREALRAA